MTSSQAVKLDNSQAVSVEEPTELDNESKAPKEIDYYIQFTQQEKIAKLGVKLTKMTS